MDVTDYAALFVSIAAGLGVGGYIFAWAFTSRMRTLAFELLAHPKLTQILALGAKFTGGGKLKFADIGLGFLSRWLGGMNLTGTATGSVSESGAYQPPPTHP